MDELMIHIRIFTEDKIHHVWIRDTYAVRDFLKDIQKSWHLENTNFEHFFYHIESNRILDPGQSFYDNIVMTGDHCILF